jgi:TusA-related sulfurtransferase
MPQVRNKTKILLRRTACPMPFTAVPEELMQIDSA